MAEARHRCRASLFLLSLLRLDLEIQHRVHAAHAAALRHAAGATAVPGTSATMASVVISSAATEAAFWIATRTTLVR